jgi:hypothetical protein
MTRILFPTHVDCDPQSVFANHCGDQTPREFIEATIAQAVDEYCDDVGLRFVEQGEPDLSSQERRALRDCFHEVLWDAIRNWEE